MKCHLKMTEGSARYKGVNVMPPNFTSLRPGLVTRLLLIDLLTAMTE